MYWKKLFTICHLLILLQTVSVWALGVDIQGVQLEPKMPGASCIDIAEIIPECVSNPIDRIFLLEFATMPPVSIRLAFPLLPC
jgi:hypothetical protein